MKKSLPDTGISGVYEVILGVEDPGYALKYFAEFGFTQVESGRFSEEEATLHYGVPSAFQSFRLQNGVIDSHGLLRILAWEKPLGPGIGYAPPTAVGQRMAVMRTADIIRLTDIYAAARVAGEKWLATAPVADDLFGLDDKKKDFFTRPVIVRESAVYGEVFNHVFFQRYGYQIPGYGTIGEHSNLKTSEFTHHDFIIKGDISALGYLETALGLQSEAPPQLNGDWQRGPKEVFQFKPGESHWYWGFVSPNNICGKLKFFTQQPHQPDLSHHQRLGESGITAHTFHTPKLELVYDLVQKDSRLSAYPIANNEFGEKSFLFRDTLGCTWQIIEKQTTNHQPATELKFESTPG